MLSVLPVAIAYADEGAAAGGAGGFLGQLGMIPMLVVFFAIFYFVILRPQQKQAKNHKMMLANLKEGDSIVTSSGIFGRIAAVNEDSFSVEIADRVRVKISKEAVMLKK